MYRPGPGIRRTWAGSADHQRGSAKKPMKISPVASPWTWTSSSSPDYSHPFIQPPSELSFAHLRITGVFGAHTAPFPVGDFALLCRTLPSAPRARLL